MLEAAAVVSNGGFSSHSSQLHSCGDSSEEELSVLPRHTKVVVTGNNRTKSVLVGLQGVVKKAVGLGGWHWLVKLKNSTSKMTKKIRSFLPFLSLDFLGIFLRCLLKQCVVGLTCYTFFEVGFW